MVAVMIALTAVIPSASGLSVSAESAVLMCIENGAILFDKDADKRLSMASTTKIMTSLLALEYAQPEKEIIVTTGRFFHEQTCDRRH